MKFSSKQFWKQTPKIVCTLWDSYLRLTERGCSSEQDEPDDNIVMRGGKPYRVQKDASWA